MMHGQKYIKLVSVSDKAIACYLWFKIRRI